MIHILDGQNNKILGVIPDKHIIDNKHIQSLEHYIETFWFETFADQGFSEHLTKINRVIIPREDQGYHELVIDISEKYNGDGGAKVRVHASGSYLMLKKATIIDPQTFTERSASMMLGIALNGTEFQPGIVESQAIRTFSISAHSDPFRLLKVIANEYGLELRFRIETDGGEVTGRYVDLIERNGEWRGRETVFGKDIENIRRTEKTDNIYTALRGLGPEDEDGNRLEVFVEDMDALQRWGRTNPQTGELRHLVGVYEPQSSNFDMTIAQLTQYTRTELNKRINSVIEYEINVIDLENVVGEENKKMRYGDTIRIKDTTFNPPLYIDARVFEQERDITRRTHKRIKLGDFTEYNEEEVLAIWKSLQDEIRKKISASQLVEYTYSKIEIDNKDEYIFTEGKTFAEAVGITAEDNAKQFAVNQDSALKIDVEGYADQVADQAEDNAKSYAEDKSAQALQQALAESVAKATYNTKMAQIASDLGDKAGIAYVDGQLVSAIEGIAIGGRNLFIYSRRNVVNHGQGTLDFSRNDTPYGFYMVGHRDDLDDIRMYDVLDGNGFYTISFDLRGSQNGVGTTGVNINGSNETRFRTRADNEWERVSVTFEVTNYDYENPSDNYIGFDPGWQYIWHRYVQVEKGNKATDWQPAPEDIFSEIDTKADGSTVYTISEVDNMINNVVSVTQYTTDINGIVTDLGSQGTQIGQNHEAIGLKANKTDLDTVAGTVSDHSAQFLTMADEISARVTADYVQTAIDDVEIGGRNLARYSGRNYMSVGDFVWSGDRDRTQIVSKDGRDCYYNLGHTYFRVSSISPIEEGETYTWSAYVRAEDGYAGEFRWTSYVNSSHYGSTYHQIDDGWKKIIHTFVAEGSSDLPHIRYDDDDLEDYGVYFADFKLEKGNKATDWTPAPEDTQAEISSLSAELSAQAGIISAKADSSTVNALGTRISTAETTIDAIEEEITSFITTSVFDGLEERVNTAEQNIRPDSIVNTVTESTAYINDLGEKVEADDVKSIFTQEANSFTFSANQINFDGHVFGQDATFTGNFEVYNAEREVTTLISDEITQEREIPSISGVGSDKFMVKDGVLFLESNRVVEHAGQRRNFINSVHLLNGEITFNSEIVGLESSSAKIMSRNGVVDLGGHPLMGLKETSNGFVEVCGIESQGSNADGHWIRYASGIQMCWLTRSVVSVSTSSANFQGVNYHRASVHWSYPQSFISDPSVTFDGGISAATLAPVFKRIWGRTNTSISLQIMSVTSFNTVEDLSYFAIGRWR